MIIFNLHFSHKSKKEWQWSEREKLEPFHLEIFFEGNAWNEMRWCQCKMVWRCHTTRHWFDYNHQSSREAKKSSEKNVKKTHAHKHFYFVRKLMDVCAWRMYIRSNKWNWNTRWRNVEKLTVLKCWPHKNIFTLKGRAYFTCFFVA